MSATVPAIPLLQIPLYRQLYGEMPLPFDATFHCADVPVLEKHHVTKDFPRNWMTDTIERELASGTLEFTTTSGTTSDRMQVMRKKDWWQDEYRRTYRYNPRMASFVVGQDRKALLTTAICSNTTCFLEQPSYEERILHNALYLNSTPDPNHWTKGDIERIASEISRFEPIYIDADPVFLALFLRFLEKYEVAVDIPLPRYLTLSYELSTRSCRRFIQSRWDLPIYDLYGATEIGYLYLEDDTGVMQRCRDLSTVELAPYDAERGIYYLLVTSLKNEYMPLIRYRIGDLVKVDETPERVAASKTHDDIPIAYLCGRAKDAVTSPSGRTITPGELDHALARVAESLLFYQVVLHKNDLLLFRYVSLDEQVLPRAEQEAIRECLVTLFGTCLDVSFLKEVAISPEASGKFATLKQD